MAKENKTASQNKKIKGAQPGIEPGTTPNYVALTTSSTPRWEMTEIPKGVSYD
jgi:hypothetical protein